jgi:hypothetical protein
MESREQGYVVRGNEGFVGSSATEPGTSTSAPLERAYIYREEASAIVAADIMGRKHESELFTVHDVRITRGGALR